MKIAILSYGHFASIFPLAKSLAEEHDVCLYMMVNGNNFSESICSFNLEGFKDGLYTQQSSINLLERKIQDYLGKRIKLRLFKYPDLRLKNLKNYTLSVSLSNHLKEECYEIVHFNGISFFPFFIALLMKFRRIIWTIHDPVLHSGEEKKGAEVLYKILCFLGINIIIHNRSSEEEFKKMYRCASRKIHFLPYAPLEVFQIYKMPNIPVEPNTIIFFGRISKYKGIEFLIEAAKLAQATIKDLKLIIAGSGDYYIDLAVLHDNSLYEIHNKYLPNDELVHLIQRSSIVICPYTDATQSGVIMTAYALLKPVIASNVGGIPEVIIDNETGRLVPPGNIEGLADIIIEMLSDTEMLGKYSKAIGNYYFKGEFSWRYISNHLILIYDKVIRSKRTIL